MLKIKLIPIPLIRIVNIMERKEYAFDANAQPVQNSKGGNENQDSNWKMGEKLPIMHHNNLEGIWKKT